MGDEGGKETGICFFGSFIAVENDEFSFSPGAGPDDRRSVQGGNFHSGIRSEGDFIAFGLIVVIRRKEFSFHTGGERRMKAEPVPPAKGGKAGDAQRFIHFGGSGRRIGGCDALEKDDRPACCGIFFEYRQRFDFRWPGGSKEDPLHFVPDGGKFFIHPVEFKGFLLLLQHDLCIMGRIHGSDTGGAVKNIVMVPGDGFRIRPGGGCFLTLYEGIGKGALVEEIFHTGILEETAQEESDEKEEGDNFLFMRRLPSNEWL